MGKRKYQELRLALFANSYCGKHLAKMLQVKYEDDRLVALKEITLLANALNFKKQSLREAVIKGKCFRQSLNSKCFVHQKDGVEIPIFLTIEKEMIEIAENRFMEDLLGVEDYNGGILESAVERAVGNKLTNIADNNKFNQRYFELGKTYRRCYYRVAYRYKLPTIRILPFILRLVDSKFT